MTDDAPDLPECQVRERVAQLQAADASSGEIALPALSTARASWLNADSDTLRFLAATVHALGPRHVIEFGCGVTTELLAHLACEHGRMAMTCFEHDPWVAAEFVDLCGGLALNYRWFSFCICPLVARRIGGRLLPVYDDRMTAPTVPYPADLVVINGPPDALGGRAGMMYQALTYARPGTVALVLNVRKGEEAMFEGWMGDLAAHLEFVQPGFLGHHLGFVIREPLADAFSLETPMAQEVAARERAAFAAEGTQQGV